MSRPQGPKSQKQNNSFSSSTNNTFNLCANDPFFKDKKNKGLSEILDWLIKEKRRCEQQAFFMVNPKDPQAFEKIILEKIKKKDYV